MPLVIGIDAGGSKTVGLLADERGAVRAEGRAGGANLHLYGAAGCERALREVLAALAAPEPPAAVCIGIAGAERGPERALLLPILERLGLPVRRLVVHDAAIALAAGSRQRTGIVVISGTGSIAFGLDERGDSARAGGWGQTLGDEGSASWLGQEALRRALRALDGRGEPTALVGEVEQALGVRSPDDLVEWLRAGGAVSGGETRARDAGERERPPRPVLLATLVPLLDRAAAAGDPVASAIVAEAAAHLVAAARAVARRLALAPGHALVLAGGAFRASPRLAAQVRAQAAQAAELRRAVPAVLATEPAHGAVAMARELLA